MKVKRYVLSGNNKSIELVKEFLKEAKKSGLPIYWGTYNVSFPLGESSQKTLEEIKKACGKSDLRIICEPTEKQMIPFGRRSLLTKDTYDLLIKKDIEIKYYSSLDDEHKKELDFTHHAKYLLTSNMALVGSFNFSYQSLHNNMESLVWLSGDEIKGTYDEVSAKWDDGIFRDVDRSKLVNQKASLAPPQDDTDSKINLKEIYKKIREKLYDYQKDILDNLADRDLDIDILCLPTGLGKTFIALAWLLQQGKDHHDEARMLMIVPNRLVRETIKNICINEIKMPDLIHVIHILTANEFNMGGACVYSAAVFDEVQNWIPGDEFNDYNLARAELNRRSVKMLGVSATPSRHPNYDQEYFYREFCNKKGAPYSELTVVSAINSGLLAKPNWVTVSKSCGDLNDYRPIKGRYSEGILMRKWWNALMEDEELAQTICETIISNNLNKGLVFVPPVGEDKDGFLEDLQDALDGYAEVLDIQSKSCSSPESVLRKFRDAKKPTFLFAVNRASEGISIPEIDSLIMLRMPLSENLAIQLIGRGLRKHDGKKQLWVLDAVGYQRRLEDIPSWGESSQSKPRSKKVVTRDAQDKSKELVFRLIMECCCEDTDYSYDLFLSSHVNNLLENREYEQLISRGFKGDLKVVFGKQIGIKVYGINAEKDRKILSNLPESAQSSETLREFIEENKEDFVCRYMNAIEEEESLQFAKDSSGHLSFDEFIDDLLSNASIEMREELLSRILDYDYDYVDKVKNNKSKCKSILIEHFIRSSRSSSLS